MSIVKTIAYLSTLIMGGIIVWANSQSNFFENAGEVADTASVSYTHLTLPTNREV